VLLSECKFKVLFSLRKLFCQKKYFFSFFFILKSRTFSKEPYTQYINIYK
jgi:hypothetical protein